MQPRVVAAACVLLTMIPAAVSVQEGPDAKRRWWRVARIQRQLRLTSAQIATLDAVFERGLPERIDRHRQIESRRSALSRTFAGDSCCVGCIRP